MAVTSKVQGLQIGRKLGEAAIERARELRANLIYLESNRILTAALHLYSSLGFVEKIRPFDSVYDRSDIYMELTLKA